MTPDTLHWYVNDPDGEGYSWHASEAAALAHAQAALTAWRGDGDEWPAGAEQMTVGCVTHCATQVNLSPCVDGCHASDDWHCDLEMRPAAEYGAERRAAREARHTHEEKRV